MSRAINIGELLQSGILGGAQIYNQQAARRQQGEIANRELDQREAIRNDRLVETEFQRQQQMAAAQRLLDQEAADGAIFAAIRSMGEPRMGPTQPGVPEPDPFAGIDLNVLAKASPRAQDIYTKVSMNREGARQNRVRLQNKYNFMSAQGTMPFLVEDEYQEMVDYGIQMTPEDMPWSMRERTAAGQAARRDATLTMLTEFTPEEIANYATVPPEAFNAQAKSLMEENMRRTESRMKREEKQAAMAEDLVEAQRFAAANGTTLDDAVFLGREGRKQVIFDKVRTRPDTITDDEMRILTEGATKRLDRARDAYMKVNIDDAGDSLGFMPPTPEEVKRASQPASTSYGDGVADMEEPKHQRLRARVAAFEELRTAIAEESAARTAAKTLAEQRKQGDMSRRVPRAPLPFGGGGADFAPTQGPPLPEDQSIDEMIRRGASDEEIEAAISRGVQ